MTELLIYNNNYCRQMYNKINKDIETYLVFWYTFKNKILLGPIRLQMSLPLCMPLNISIH